MNQRDRNNATTILDMIGLDVSDEIRKARESREMLEIGNPPVGGWHQLSPTPAEIIANVKGVPSPRLQGGRNRVTRRA